MSGDSSDQVFDTVARRWQLLDLLASGTTDKATMVEALDVSRSTVNRAVVELDELSLIRRGEHGYETTPLGRTALRAYRFTVDTFEGMLAAAPVVQRFPRWFQPSLALFSGCTVALDDADPHRPIRTLVDTLTGADRVRGVHGPARFDLPAEAREWLLSPDTEADLVFSEAAAEFLEAYHLPDLRRAADAGGLTVGVVDETFPLTVLVAEGADWAEVVVAVTGDGGAISGVLVNDRPEAVAWAESFVETYRDRAAASPMLDSVDSIDSVD